MFKRNDDALSSVGQAQKPSEETQEVTSPFKSKSKAEESKVNDISQVGLGKEKKTQGRGKLKQEAEANFGISTMATTQHRREQ